MPTLIHRRVQAARDGSNPYVVCRLKSGWVVAGDVQFLAGYCLLLPDPVVPNLNSLTDNARIQFLADMALLGDAIIAVTSALRANYEILGNLEPALHAHVFPRYVHEPKELATRPVWFYDWENATKFDPMTHGPLMQKIREYLQPHLIA